MSTTDATHTKAYAEHLLRETREELARADSKASILFGVFGLVVGAILAGMIGGNVDPFALANRIEWVFWAGVGTSVSGVVALAAAVFPRSVHPGSRYKVAFFGHVVEFDTREAFSEALMQAAEVSEARLHDQIWHLSFAVNTKYRLTRRALWWFGVGTGLMVAATGVDVLFL